FSFVSLASRSPDILTLSAVFLLTVTTAQGKKFFPLMLIVTTILTGFYSPANKELVFDAHSLTVFLFMLIAAATVGRAIYTLRTKEHERQVTAQNRKDKMVSLLHDSVATDLTALISRLEALKIEYPSATSSIQTCSDKARHAMDSTRELLREKDASPSLSKPKTTTLSITTVIVEAIQELKSHGYTVKSSIEPIPKCHSNYYGQVIQECLKEAITNVIKYASPASLVELNVKSNKNVLCISIQNTLSTIHNIDSSNGLGLESLRQKLSFIGASINIHNSKNHWKIAFKIPT
ncbi:MAG: histidine kinase, partial [Corynebacterium casei]|uniref:sensor histidine kinase n=2 Tax=Corynebacterium casei TaxID=160386 RepID=UPI002647D0EE